MTPDSAEVHNIITGLSLHPEFALSRREIVKYILTPAGKRADDVQTLLRLDQIEKVRKSLQKVANDAKKELDTKIDEDERAKKNLLQHLQIPSLSKTALLQVVNAHRATLKMEQLTDLVPGQTTLKGDLKTEKQPTKAASKVSKAAGTAQLADFTRLLTFPASEEAARLRTEALNQLQTVNRLANVSPVLPHPTMLPRAAPPHAEAAATTDGVTAEVLLASIVPCAVAVEVV